MGTQVSVSTRARLIRGLCCVLLWMPLAATASAQITADFTATPTEGISALSVEFTDTSTGGAPFLWIWDFGDGQVMGVQHPTHTYTSPGTYTVSLSVLSAGMPPAVEVKKDFITVHPAELTVAFDGSPSQGPQPLEVAFTDQTATTGGGPTAWLWDFGDGTTSTLQNPNHVYEVAETTSFDVSLTAFVGPQSEMLVETAFITVDPAPLVVDFDATPSQGGNPLQVAFTDMTTGAPTTAWSWEFGDGGASTEKNPTHTFYGAGSFDVMLTAFAGPQGASTVKRAFVYVDAAQPHQAYLKASNPGQADLFGVDMSLSGDTLVIGALQEDSGATGVDGVQGDNSESNAGAAYVFTRTDGSWHQQAYLKASNTKANDNFGIAVALSGDTLVIGATGEGSDSTGVNGDQTNQGNPNSGAAYVFVRDGTTWTQQAYLKASDSTPLIAFGDRFGTSVAISGDTIVVGAIDEDSGASGVNGDDSDNSVGNSGAAYVFVREGATWTQQAYLKASNPDVFDQFGRSVAISGDTIVVGSALEDSPATGVDGDQGNGGDHTGAAYVFVREGTTWSQQAYLKASNTEASGLGDSFGQFLAISEDTIVVGAFGESSAATGIDGDQSDNSAADAGAAYVFVRDGTTWSQQTYLKASNTDPGDVFGTGVAISGDTVVVASGGEDSGATGVNGDQLDNDVAAAGAAYVFTRDGSTWSQQVYAKGFTSESIDSIRSVGFSGDTLVLGSQGEDSGAAGINGDVNNNDVPGAGAAYVYDLSEPPECFLVIGEGPGSSTFLDINHLFDTQVGPTVEEIHPVLMEDIPEFVLPRVPTPSIGPLRQAGVVAGSVGSPLSPTAGNSPAWMQDGQFAVQVLMWNPGVFPALPEQYTSGLFVSVLADGTVLTAPYGTNLGGLEIWHELDTNALGQRVIRFPFEIPGL